MLNSQMKTRDCLRKRLGAVLLGAGLIAGYVAGSGTSTLHAVRADVTEEPRRDAFKAGGVLNEPILRDISATLKRMETRLEQIEKNTAASAKNR